LIEVATATAIWALMGLAAFTATSRSRAAGWRIGLPVMLLSALAASWLTASWYRNLGSSGILFAALVTAILPLQRWLRLMQWPARFFFVSTVVATVAFGITLVMLTLTIHATPLGLGLPVLLLVLEAGALSLGLVFAYEMAEARGRRTAGPLALGSAASYTPRVCLQVPGGRLASSNGHRRSVHHDVQGSSPRPRSQI